MIYLLRRCSNLRSPELRHMIVDDPQPYWMMIFDTPRERRYEKLARVALVPEKPEHR